jgi:ABC-type transport system substrate-binding protein
MHGQAAIRRNGYYNDVTSKMVRDAGQEMDNDKRIGMYQQANKIIQQEGPFCMLFQPMFEHAVRSNIESFYAAPTFDLWKLYPITKK